jgi:hypothetical protein
MPPVCRYVLLRLLACRVATHASTTAGGSIWAMDAPAWITAIATVGLLVGAIVTARYAIKAFRAQDKQVAILAKQNDRDIADRHQAQAARVFTGVEDPGSRYAHPYAKNASDFPVYDAQFWQADQDGLSKPDAARMIPPGGVARDSRDFHYQDAVANTVLTFRDAAGARWIRMPDGTLEEQTHPTAAESIRAALRQSPARGASELAQAEEPALPEAE